MGVTVPHMPNEINVPTRSTKEKLPKITLCRSLHGSRRLKTVAFVLFLSSDLVNRKQFVPFGLSTVGILIDHIISNCEYECWSWPWFRYALVLERHPNSYSKHTGKYRTHQLTNRHNIYYKRKKKQQGKSITSCTLPRQSRKQWNKFSY